MRPPIISPAAMKLPAQIKRLIAHQQTLHLSLTPSFKSLCLSHDLQLPDETILSSVCDPQVITNQTLHTPTDHLSALICHIILSHSLLLL